MFLRPPLCQRLFRKQKARCGSKRKSKEGELTSTNQPLIIVCQKERQWLQCNDNPTMLAKAALLSLVSFLLLLLPHAGSAIHTVRHLVRSNINGTSMSSSLRVKQGTRRHDKGPEQWARPLCSGALRCWNWVAMGPVLTCNVPVIGTGGLTSYMLGPSAGGHIMKPVGCETVKHCDTMGPPRDPTAAVRSTTRCTPPSSM